MATFLFYFFVAFLLPLIAGGIIGLVFYSLWQKYIRRKIKKNYDKIKGTEDFKKLTLDGGRPTNNEKEGKEDEQRKYQRYREFEKLRKLASEQRSPRVTRTFEPTGKDDRLIRTEGISERRGNISPSPYKQLSNHQLKSEKSIRRVKLDS